MRFMVIVKASPESESGAMPDPGMISAMGRYNDALIAAGVMLDAAGLQASAKGVRVNFDGKAPLVTDGPFTETKELVGGYWIWQCKDLAEAIAWLKKAPFQSGEVEIRPFSEPEDFAGVASPELIAQEQGWRDAQAQRAPKPA
jgi:hypothetical protein